jgi:hypothetical protein
MFLLNIVEGGFVSRDGSNILTNFETDILPREKDEIAIKESPDTSFIVTKVLIDFRSYSLFRRGIISNHNKLLGKTPATSNTTTHGVYSGVIRVFVFVDNTGFARLPNSRKENS